MPDLVYTVEEAADLLKIGRTKAWEMARGGQLPVLRLGRLVRVPASALEAWVAGCGQNCGRTTTQPQGKRRRVKQKGGAIG